VSDYDKSLHRHELQQLITMYSNIKIILQEWYGILGFNVPLDTI